MREQQKILKRGTTENGANRNCKIIFSMVPFNFVYVLILHAFPTASEQQHLFCHLLITCELTDSKDFGI